MEIVFYPSQASKIYSYTKPFADLGDSVAIGTPLVNLDSMVIQSIIVAFDLYASTVASRIPHSNYT
jgi:hypothetical protein